MVLVKYKPLDLILMKQGVAVLMSGRDQEYMHLLLAAEKALKSPPVVLKAPLLLLS